MPGAAPAHEFSLGVHASGEDARARVVSAVRGALLAADERDGHPDETSDGHLGGVDVHIVPLPEGRPLALPELVNAHQGKLDLLLLLDSVTAAGTALPGVTDQTIVLGPRELPGAADWPRSRAAEGFVARYRDAWATEPDVSAAQGYNAARRIDDAIRPHDGLEQTKAIRDALAHNGAAVDWQ